MASEKVDGRPAAHAGTGGTIPFWMAFLFLVVAAISWSGSAVAGRAASGSVPPFTLSFIRWFFVALCFLALAWRETWQQRHAILRQWPMLSAFGFFGVVGFTVPYYVGLQYTVAVNASLMNASGTVWIVMTTFLMTGETVTRRQTAGIAIGFLGTILIVLRGDFGRLSGFSINIGDILVLVAFFSWAVYTVMLRWRPKDIGEMPFLVAITVYATLIMLPLWIYDLAIGLRFEPTPDNLIITGYAVLFPSVMAYILWNRAVPVVGTGVAGMAQYMIPVFGTIFAVLVLGESIETYHLAGIAVIFLGVWLVTSGRRKTASA